MMKKTTPRMVLVCVAVLAAFWLFHRIGGRFDEVEYRGQVFKLSKAYWDYDDYKNDAHNLAPGQEPLIVKAMLDAKLEPAYPDLGSVIYGAGGLRFPGYGSSWFGQHAQSDGSLLAGGSAEIPMASKERVWVYRATNGVYQLVDDFVADESEHTSTVTLRAGTLEYSDRNGRVIVTHPLAASK